ncbi:transporter, partial [Microcoleus sp. HI-ES]|nr:transporter [Microcoleus sp. HI-ES]
MRVFRQIIVVGVGAAITFSNAAQSASAQSPTQSQDSLALSNQLELGPNIRSTSNTAAESASQAEQSIALNPPTGPEQASKPQQAAPASPSTLSQAGSTPLRGLGPTDAQQPSPIPPNNVPVPSSPVPILRGTPNESFPPLPPRGILDTKPPASLEP